MFNNLKYAFRSLKILIKEFPLYILLEIVNALELTQSAVSHQLRILKDAHVLKSEKVGKMVFYSLNDEHVRIIVETGHVHMNHKE